MGLGGSITGFMGMTGNYPKTSPPGAATVGKQYGNLLQQYLGGFSPIFNAEKQWGPQFADETMSELRGYNPGATGLLDTLSSQAQTQLDQNGKLDPATQALLQQNIRSSQAARGMGYSPADAQSESTYVTQSQEQRRAQNQQLAETVAGEQGQYYGGPGVALGGSKLVSPASQYDIFNTTYNANAAANIQNQNAQLGMISGMNSFD